jgi:regulator of protease activity HflC (stomatin/prohibitin superfamily)
MAEISGFGPFRHLRAESAGHVLHYEGATLRRSGRGLAFWFWPWSASLAEVPLDDREVVLAFHGRTADFQDVVIQGAIGYRIVDPALLAQRVDFSIDSRRGTHLRQPLEKIASMLTQLAQQHCMGRVQSTALRDLVAGGASPLRDIIEAGMTSASLLADLGLELVSVRLEPVRPEAQVERALEAPTREHIQESADEAAFRRRALAVEKERAIQENELQNQIELARRESQLIDQKGANARREATENAEAARIAAEAGAARAHIDAEAKADATRLVDGARLAIDRERMEVYRTMPPSVLVSLAAQELASKLQRIDHLQITPDLLAPLLSSLVERVGAKELPKGAAR